ncbi:MAG: DUF1217 domain-containing protein [Gemmatimonadaceae bacterium]|nr:DUF1217 domain-containing protein [Acetobacteraceae bacterium]
MTVTIRGLDLGALYGAGSVGRPGGNPIQALQQAERDQPKKIAAEARKPEVQRDLVAFRKAVAGAKDTKTLLADPVVQRVLLTVNGLADQIGFPALAVKALMSKLTDAKSLANQLPDTRWRAAAETYDFAARGLAVLRDPAVLDTVAGAYAEISWRKSLDATTPGLSDALTFRERAGSVKTGFDILGDPTLRRVVTTTLGIPREIALQTLGAQDRAVTSRLDLRKLQDPAFVDAFVKRYLIAAATGGDQPPPSMTQLAAQAFGLLL